MEKKSWWQAALDTVSGLGTSATNAYNSYQQGNLANQQAAALEVETEAKKKQREQLTQIAIIGGVVLLLGVGALALFGRRR